MTAIEGTGLTILGLLLSRPNSSYRDLMDATGLKSPNAIAGHLARLRKLGLVTWEPTLQRTVRPTCLYVSAEDIP